MILEQIQSSAPAIAIALFALAALLLILSLRMFRKSRTDSYWRRRRTAGQRGWRFFVWSVLLTLGSGMVCLATGVSGMLASRTATAMSGSPATIIVALQSPTVAQTAPVTPPIGTQPPTGTTTPTTDRTTTRPINPTETQAASRIATATASPSASPTPTGTATASLTATVTASPTASNTPSATPTATTSPTPAPTATPTLTATATETLVPIGSTPILESSVTPSANAGLKITALSAQLSANFGPATPASTFSAGLRRIYFFVSFGSMQPGVLWRRELLLDGQVMQQGTYLWGLEQEGSAYFFFGQEDGFKPGSYQIRLYIGEGAQPATMFGFTVS
jgi:hypothetical protein